MTHPWIIAESTWRTVGATACDLAVLPWGATEAHNFHLPYATDNYQSDAVAAEAARIPLGLGTRTAVLPCIPFGETDDPFALVAAAVRAGARVRWTDLRMTLASHPQPVPPAGILLSNWEI